MSYQKLSAFFILLFFSTLVFAQNENKKNSLIIGDKVEIQSKILEEGRILNIYLPNSYDPDSSKVYPVIYLLDGSIDEDFIHVAGIVQFGSFSWINMIPESIVVGIANVDRKRDFTYPTQNKKDKADFPTTGGSAKFINFIEKELQPFIAENYQVSDRKTIIGQSLGGLLATEILAVKPALFDNYIIVSPSLWWDDEALLKKDFQQYSAEKSIYVAVGKEGKIMERVAKELFEKLNLKKADNMNLHFDFFEKQNHGDALHLAVYSAFEKIFKADFFTYLAQEKPKNTPQIFAKDLISKSNESEFGSIFSKDGKEFFYGVDIDGRTEIRYVKAEKGEWTKPITIISHEKYGYNDPFLSPDEQELYYISDQPMNGKGESKDYDIWYSKRTKNGWSLPINAGPNINSSKNEYYISFTNEGKMYFSSNLNAEENRRRNFDIYTSERLKGQYQTKQKLGDAINSPAYEADVFIAPDESYMIFCATRNEVGLGRGDLYISFKDADGKWTPSKNMGVPINSENHELCPFVTADGKYLFYTSNQDIYWVSTTILDQFRGEN